MRRRWLIRSFFMLLVLLLVAGWGWSTCRLWWCGYCHRGHTVSVSVFAGAVGCSWERCAEYTEGWEASTCPIRFGVVPANFLWRLDSRGGPEHPPFYFSLLGIQYEHYIAARWSGPSAELRAARVPFWFLILATGAALVWVWRKTAPPKLGRGFAVEIEKPHD